MDSSGELTVLRCCNGAGNGAGPCRIATVLRCCAYIVGAPLAPLTVRIGTVTYGAAIKGETYTLAMSDRVTNSELTPVWMTGPTIITMKQLFTPPL
jgi:hypothetical protein